jgi:hypothetical protein
MMESRYKGTFKKIAVAAIGFAGLLHIAIAPAHFEHAPAHGLFFAGAGLVEMAWAVAAMRNLTRNLTHLGLVLAVGLIGLWGLARALPAPFGHGPEPIDTSGVACKLSEIVGGLALAGLAYQSALTGIGRAGAMRRVSVLIAAGLLAAGLSYGVARASEPLLPFLRAPAAEEDHHHEEGEAGAPGYDFEKAELPAPAARGGSRC